MDQTPSHEKHNAELLREMPTRACCVIEVGCSVGALAREYKKVNPGCRYIGVEVEPAYAAAAERYCDVVHVLDIETVNAASLHEALAADCWVFGDVLEHLKDPWSVLRAVRVALPPQGCVVACIPNAQHWSVQLRLNTGELRYEEAGLLDRTHLRWFTRRTIIELFASAGFRVVGGCPRIVPHPARERVLAGVRALAVAIGADPEVAVADSLPTQYVVRAVPA